MKTTTVAIILTYIMSSPLHATEYKGQEDRAIKSLSFEDIESIKSGDGWGMAKPAELNGYPGPRHALDLAEELNLTTDQHTISVGERYLTTEKRLDQAFNSKQFSPNTLKELIEFSAQAQADLRYVHLNAHLKMVGLLSPHQVTYYNQLRGYMGQSAQHDMH